MKETPQILDHGFKSTCGHCGHKDDIDLFTSTPISGDLNPGHYQCPNCKEAWKIVSMPAPETNKIVSCGGVL